MIREGLLTSNHFAVDDDLGMPRRRVLDLETCRGEGLVVVIRRRSAELRRLDLLLLRLRKDGDAVARIRESVRKLR